MVSAVQVVHERASKRAEHGAIVAPAHFDPPNVTGARDTETEPVYDPALGPEIEQHDKHAVLAPGVQKPQRRERHLGNLRPKAPSNLLSASVENAKVGVVLTRVSDQSRVRTNDQRAADRSSKRALVAKVMRIDLCCGAGCYDPDNSK
jgi:hypothetical protein